MGDVPVALVSGAATVANIATDQVGTLDFQIVKLDIGAAGASNPFVGGVADPENSLPVIAASGAFFNVKASILGNVAASVAGHVLVSADGHALVSVDGTPTVAITGAVFASAQVSVLGNVAASVAGHVAVS